MSRLRPLWVFRFALAALLFCGPACHKQPAAPPSPVVATFSGGSVTAADLDRAILDLPPQRRQPEDGDLLTWYEGMAREVAVQRLLLAEAQKASLDRDPEFLRAAAEVRKQAVVDVFLETEVARPERPSEAEQRTFYDAHLAELQVSEARLTQHLFLRLDPGVDPEPVVARVRKLRARVVAGEQFSAVAVDSSESESRHQKGVLGWVSPGQLAPDLDHIIFSLKVGVPSEPIRTKEGVHLFLVSAERPKKSFSFPEARPLIQRQILAERRDAILKERVGDALPEGSYVLDGEALRQVLADGDPQALVAQIGDFKLSLGELQAHAAAAEAAEPSLRSAPARTFLALLRQRELVYRYCVAHGQDKRPEVEARLQALRDRSLEGLRLRRRLLEAVDKDASRLEEYYRTNSARFSEPLQFHVQRLVVPLGSSANTTMERLERARAELDQGKETLAALASALGGHVEEPVWVTPSKLAHSDPRAAGLVVDLHAGQHSAPFRAENGLVVLRLIERREPVTLPFDKARERVGADYLATHRHELFVALSTELLDGARFEIVRPRLEELLKQPVAAEGS
jgi:parvulin-like peptidyl-prolyl isomerase